MKDRRACELLSLLFCISCCIVLLFRTYCSFNYFIYFSFSVLLCSFCYSSFVVVLNKINAETTVRNILQALRFFVNPLIISINNSLYPFFLILPFTPSSVIIPPKRSWASTRPGAPRSGPSSATTRRERERERERARRRKQRQQQQANKRQLANIENNIILKQLFKQTHTTTKQTIN